VTAGGLTVTATGATLGTGGLVVTDATTSTTPTTGSFKTAGGAGVAENLFVGGTTNSAGALAVTDATESTNSGDGSISTLGGLGVTKKANIGGNLAVTGTVSGGGAYTNASDKRFKKDIAKVQQATAKLQAITGVNFNWKQTQFPSRRFSAKLQAGFIAQEVEAVIPEVVLTDKDGWKSMAYSGLIPYLVEAVKEQADQAEAAKVQAEAAKVQAEAAAAARARLEATIEAQAAAIAQLAARLQALEEGNATMS
jgi:hypothetical protein